MNWFALFVVLAAGIWNNVQAAERPNVVVVVGAEGTEEFGEVFHHWAERWQAAAGRAGADCAIVGLDTTAESAVDATDRQRLEQILEKLDKNSTQPVWLVLIGHGTFDGKTARFNLRGPDFTPAEMNRWLKPFARPIAVINCASASAPFVAELSAPNRVVVAATKSGHEVNFARFGDYLSLAIANADADLDKDQQTSLLEAVLMASSKVREFYDTEARLATEHAILDDNGDHLGTPADWFQGLKPVKAAPDNASLDGTLARQFVLLRNDFENQLPAEARARRDKLEQDLAALRLRKSQLSEDEYFTQLEPLLIEIAKLYEQLDAAAK